MVVFGFIQLNPLPTFYLSLTLVSGYYAFKSACSTVPKLMKGPFGSKPLAERVETATKEIISGKFSPQDFVMGTDSISKRTFSLISGSLLFGTSFCLAFLAYTFYSKSLEARPIDFDKEGSCSAEIDSYKNALQDARIQSEYWQKSLCLFETHQWDNIIPKISDCFTSSSFIYDFIEDGCEKQFDKLALESKIKDIIPRDQVDLTHQKMFENKAHLGQVCASWLDETSYLANKKCSYLFPYIGFDADKMCGILNYAPFSISEDCTEACSIHKSASDTIQKTKQFAIPKTTDLTINCTEAKHFEEKDFSGRALLENKQQQSLREVVHLSHEEEKVKFDSYTPNWRNLTIQNDDFIARRYHELKDYYLVDPVDRTASQKLFLHQFSLIRRNIIRDLESKVEFTASMERLEVEKNEDRSLILNRAKTLYVR